mmetsp:Transcript_75092/g.140064  ORF Transcript_75092/g.140064 Transcript_75092/m.140064 type:complete len:181 (+) Transcript_75092:64-606(+)
MFRAALRTMGPRRLVASVAVATGISAGMTIDSSNRKLPAFPRALPLQNCVVDCHCQVPCGIFNDDGRIAAILEDAVTIRKSVSEMQNLHKGGKLQDMHQIIRWVNTKEEHATKIMTTVAEYFLAQKVKPALLQHDEYLEVLELHHKVMIAAMKTKQSSEMEAVDDLDKAIQGLRPVYEKH